MLKIAIEYLRQFYPSWDSKNYVYDKWQKDKGSEHIEKKKVSNNANILTKFAEKPQKDKEKEPPEGFFFLGGDDE